MAHRILVGVIGTAMLFPSVVDAVADSIPIRYFFYAIACLFCVCMVQIVQQVIRPLWRHRQRARKRRKDPRPEIVYPFIADVERIARN